MGRGVAVKSTELKVWCSWSADQGSRPVLVSCNPQSQVGTENPIHIVWTRVLEVEGEERYHYANQTTNANANPRQTRPPMLYNDQKKKPVIYRQKFSAASVCFTLSWISISITKILPQTKLNASNWSQSLYFSIQKCHPPIIHRYMYGKRFNTTGKGRRAICTCMWHCTLKVITSGLRDPHNKLKQNLTTR